MFKRDMCDNLTESPIVFGRLHPRPGVLANRSRPALCQPIAELTAGRTILNQPMGAEAWTNGLGSCLMLTHWLGRMRLLLLLVSSLVAAGSAELTVIEEDGWRQLLKGEWMVELWVSFLLGCWLLYLLSSQSHDWFPTGKAVSSFIPSAAPWCPACRALQPTWEEFAGWSEDLEVLTVTFIFTFSHPKTELSPIAGGRWSGWCHRKSRSVRKIHGHRSPNNLSCEGVFYFSPHW